MNRYRLDENKNPVLCANEEEFNRWHLSVPEEDRTQFGCQVSYWEDSWKGVSVSTEFLSSPAPWKGKPAFFETMVSGGECHGVFVRYSTWKEAEYGHDDVLDSIWAEE